MSASYCYERKFTILGAFCDCDTFCFPCLLLYVLPFIYLIGNVILFTSSQEPEHCSIPMRKFLEAILFNSNYMHVYLYAMKRDISPWKKKSLSNSNHKSTRSSNLKQLKEKKKDEGKNGETDYLPNSKLGMMTGPNLTTPPCAPSP